MKKKLLSFFIGIIISGAALVFAFKNVPMTELAAYIGKVNYLWIGPSVLLVLAAFFLRSIRWRVILGPDRELGFWKVHHPLMIGFMLNCIMPGRVGELARPAILFKHERVPFTTGLATVAAERVFDIAMLLLIFALMLGTIQIDPNIDIPFGSYHLTRSTLVAIGYGMVRLSLALLLGIVLISIDASRRLINRMIMGLQKLLFFMSSDFQQQVSDKIGKRLVAIIENVAMGFALVKKPGRLIVCTGLTAAIWILSGVSYYVMALGSPGIHLSVIEMFIYMVIICFFIALPSVPGYWGLWEAGGVFALALFGIAPKDAAGFTLVNHAVQIFPIIIVGLVSAMVTGVNIWKTSYPEKLPIHQENRL
jgi:uncharacterized protein (TIRG00374 family)